MQIRKDWDLDADVHKPGWGIIYPLIVHDAHLDLQEYDKAVGLDDIVVREVQEDVDKAEAKQKKQVLKRVKREEQSDDERGGPKPKKGIRQLNAEMRQKRQRGH